MRAPNVWYGMLMVCVLASCKKEQIVSADSNSEIATANPESGNVILQQTIHGLGIYGAGAVATEPKLDYAGIKIARTQIVLSQSTKSDVIGRYLKDGYEVQVNLNWGSSILGPVPYPTDTKKIRQQAESFFSYYKPYKSQIPIVVVENEWDNISYHSGTLADYLTELAIITEVGHKYGFKIADAGLSSTSLQRWVYSQLDDSNDAKQWMLNYWVGPKLSNYPVLIKAVEQYAKAINNIPIDYLNVHWYNLTHCANGFTTASQLYKNYCNKTILITNEFGVKSNSHELFANTVKEVDGNVLYAIAYSGNGAGNGKTAVPLTNPMLSEL